MNLGGSSRPRPGPDNAAPKGADGTGERAPSRGFPAALLLPILGPSRGPRSSRPERAKRAEALSSCNRAGGGDFGFP